MRLNVDITNFIQETFVDSELFRIEKSCFLFYSLFLYKLLPDLIMQNQLSFELALLSLKVLLSLWLLIRQKKPSLFFSFLILLHLALDYLLFHLELLNTHRVINWSLSTSISITKHCINILLVFLLSLIKKHVKGKISLLLSDGETLIFLVELWVSLQNWLLLLTNLLKFLKIPFFYLIKRFVLIPCCC